MLKSKRSTRPSEGKQEALDVLSADEKVRLNLDIPKTNDASAQNAGRRGGLLCKRHRTQISR